MKVSINQRRIRNEPCWVVDWTGLDGKRQRRFFSSKRAAEAEAANANAQRRETGDVWLALTAEQRNEALAVIAEVQQRGVTLRQVWEEWRAGMASMTIERRTLGAAIQECIDAKRTAGRRPKYIKDLRCLLRAFARGREGTAITRLSTSDVETWVADRFDAPWSRATAISRLSTLFAFCLRRRYVRENPCVRIERITIDQKPPQILSVRQAAKVLVYIKRRHPRGLAWFVLALMAGIRPQECDRLAWTNLDLEAGIVTVDAAASKVHRRRIIHLQPAALAWLRVAASLGSDLPLPHVTRCRHLRSLRKKLGFEHWPQDILRHTCASFLMALWQDAGRVATELGNSAGVLLRHYRELVRREEAERFWRLVPRHNARQSVKSQVRS